VPNPVLWVKPNRATRCHCSTASARFSESLRLMAHKKKNAEGGNEVNSGGERGGGTRGAVPSLKPSRGTAVPSEKTLREMIIAWRAPRVA
jgi:hypothetical protein